MFPDQPVVHVDVKAAVEVDDRQLAGHEQGAARVQRQLCVADHGTVGCCCQRQDPERSHVVPIWKRATEDGQGQNT